MVLEPLDVIDCASALSLSTVHYHGDEPKRTAHVVLLVHKCARALWPRLRPPRTDDDDKEGVAVVDSLRVERSMDEALAGLLPAPVRRLTLAYVPPTEQTLDVWLHLADLRSAQLTKVPYLTGHPEWLLTTSLGNPPLIVGSTSDPVLPQVALLSKAVEVLDRIMEQQAPERFGTIPRGAAWQRLRRLAGRFLTPVLWLHVRPETRAWLQPTHGPRTELQHSAELAGQCAVYHTVLVARISCTATGPNISSVSTSMRIAELTAFS